jgi:hypothetical protein
MMSTACKAFKPAFVIFSLLFLSCLLIPQKADAYVVVYKEDWYRLYHLHLHEYPDDTMENIYWLEQAVKADFCNPLYALTPIKDKTEWEKYRDLFMMHINLKLCEQHLFLGNKWNKRNAYFYNAPWKAQNLDSLKTAETCYKTALYYWNEAKTWAAKANDKKFRWIDLEKLEEWQDEASRIAHNTLDYERTVNRELRSLETVRAQFNAMDDKTY